MRCQFYIWDGIGAIDDLEELDHEKEGAADEALALLRLRPGDSTLWLRCFDTNPFDKQVHLVAMKIDDHVIRRPV